MSIEIKSPNAPGTGQLRCPKCGAMRFNVHASDLAAANGRVECSNCGHIRIIAAFACSPTFQANKGLDTESFKA